MLKIFENLDGNSILSASEVCKKWYEVTQYQTIIKRTPPAVIYHKEKLDWFVRSKRKINCYLEITDAFNPMLRSMEPILSNINSLLFYFIEFPSYMNFIRDMESLKNLKQLYLRGCTFINVDICRNKNFTVDITYLELACVSDSESIPVNHLLSCIPKLNCLDFFLQHNDHEAIEQSVLNYLENIEQSKNLRMLDLTLQGGGNVLSNVFQLKHLNLTSFKYKSIKIVKNFKEMTKFILNQKNLIKLHLMDGDYCPKILKICKFLPNLKQLLFCLNNVSSECYEKCDLKNLWKLESLIILNANSNFFQNVSKEISCLKKLYLYGYHGDILAISSRLNKFIPTLTVSSDVSNGLLFLI